MFLQLSLLTKLTRLENILVIINEVILIYFMNKIKLNTSCVHLNINKKDLVYNILSTRGFSSIIAVSYVFDVHEIEEIILME